MQEVHIFIYQMCLDTSASIYHEGACSRPTLQLEDKLDETM